jgi:hypothetical protein
LLSGGEVGQGKGHDIVWSYSSNTT